MIKISFLLLFVALIISQQIQYDINSTINILCQNSQKNLNFKLLRQFAIAIISSQTNAQVKLYNNNHTCTFTSTNSICIFNNMTKYVKLICSQTQNIILQVFKPQILTKGGHNSSARFIEVHFASDTHGIVNLELDSKFSYDLRASSDIGELNKFFLFTECFLMGDYFEDKVKLAVQKTNNDCVIGLKEHHEPKWTFSQGEQKLTIDNKSHKGYIHKMRDNSYKFDKRQNILIQMMILSENIGLLKEISVQIQFFLQKVSLQSYNLQNFEKGIFPVAFTIFFNKTFDQIKLNSNKDVFYNINLDHNIYLPIIEINADEYIYFDPYKEFEFLIALDSIQEQQFTKKKLYLLSSYHQSLNISYAECNDTKCSKYDQYKVLSDNYFIPQCKVIRQNQCKIKIKIIGQSEKQIGLLPYIPENIITLQLNKIHKGILKNKKILIYQISKNILETQHKSEITIQTIGVKAFLTYNNKCNRINCCEYIVYDNQLTFPKINENLTIFLQGTKQNYYSLLVNTNRDKQYLLNQNQFTYSFLRNREDHKYYIFEIKNNTKSLQINLNSPIGSLAMLVNIQKQQFANNASSSQIYSSSGYLSIMQEKLVSKKIYITISRLQIEQQKLDYSILVIADKGLIQMQWQKIFYTKISDIYPKTFSLKLQKKEIFEGEIGLKIDLEQIKQKEFINIQLGNLKNYSQSINITRLSTLKWNTQTLLAICMYTKEEICQLNIKMISNSKWLIGIQVLFWKSTEPFKLEQNKLMKFESGGLGQINQLYFDFRRDSRPMNIYIYSNEVLIKSAFKIFFHKKQQKIFYNIFPRLNEDKQSTGKQKTTTFTSTISKYYRKQQLRFPIGYQAGTILITIRDLVSNISKSHRNQLQSFVNGTIKVGISRGILQFHDGDKFEYLLLPSQTQIFIYDLVTFIKSSKGNEQIYFFTTNIIGKSIISYQLIGNGRVIQSASNISNFVVINLNNIIDKQKLKIFENLHIRFVVKNQNQSGGGRYLSTITSTNLNFRQIILGVPTEYFIRNNSGMIFQYIDLYPDNFKIKTDRKQGLPQYKIRSCKPEQDRLICLKSLQINENQNMSDTYTLSGRSHQLQIHKKSQHYCKGCRYYIAFYAFQKDISGTIIITKKQSFILLQQGKTFTSMIYADQIDYYKIIPPINVPIEISIISHVSQINADVEMNQMTDKVQLKPNNITHLQNSYSLTINGTDNPIQIIIRVKSKEGQHALYTIVFTARSKLIQLKDGVPLSFVMPRKSINHFQYKYQKDSNLLVLSKTELDISILCQNKKIQTVKQHMLNYKSVGKSINYPFSNDTCQTFEIILQNQQQASYQILINGLDILMLPFNQLLPGKVGQNKSKTYQILIQQKTYLKFVLRFCNYGIAKLMIAEDKISLDKQQYLEIFQTSGANGFFVFDYIASPGLLYFQVQSTMLQMEYSIQVFPYFSHNELKRINIELSDPLIKYQQGQNIDKYQIQFSKITLYSKQKYNVEYFAIISNNKYSLLKYVNCVTGVPYDKNQIIEQFKIIPVNQFNKQIVFQFGVLHDHQYLTILPRFDPELPSYIGIPKYQIIELYKGKGISFSKKFFNFAVILLAKISGIRDQYALNVLFMLSFILCNILMICCACCIYARYCRQPLIIDRRFVIPSNQRESRRIKIQNSLDMIQRQANNQNQSQEMLKV